MQKTQNDIAIVWYRNDLRTQDNPVLNKAIDNHEAVIACYCFDPRQFETTAFGFKKTGNYRAQFLIETVRELRTNLQQLNIELFVFHELPEIALLQLASNHHVDYIYSQKVWTSEEVNVSENVRSALPETVKLITYFNQFLYHPDDIPMAIPDIPKVFTQFRKVIESSCQVRPLEAKKSAKKLKHLINTTPIPSLSDLGLETFDKHSNTAFPFKGGEDEGLKRLHYYIFDSKKIGVYKKTRNGLIGRDYSSKLSAWLANGSISPRTIYWDIKKFETEHYKNDSTYWLIFELIWRDFFKYISLKHGNAIFKIGGILHKSYDWNNDQERIEKWIEGRCKSDFVNANMIELKKTGWMSNRGRQNVASYFAKELLIDWRIGASYFESLLIDYDVDSNYGNWMYVAGIGNDPRDRKFNVDRQAEHYDSHGKYRRLWLQETLF